MFGKDSEEKRMEASKEESEKQRAHSMHQTAISSAETGKSAEILRQLSEIDDLPMSPESDPILGQLVSTITSTSNLTSEDVRSHEWVAEYLSLLWKVAHPPEYGLTGDLRAWAYNDRDEWKEPLTENKQSEVESFLSNRRLALTRSDDFRAVEEATRTVNESILQDESKKNESTGGLLGRFR